MRFEILGNNLFSLCKGDTNQYLGMENGDIPDANIMTSDGNQKGRLNSQNEFEISSPSVTNPWIQADIGYQTCVSGVVTLGDGDSGGAGDWITSFWVSTSRNSTSAQVFIKENGENKVSLILFTVSL